MLAESDYGHRVKELTLGIQFLSDVLGGNMGGPALTLGTLNALIAANPHRICPELVDQLKLARRRKKNRMYAKRSRQRRQSGDAHGATAAKSARMQCKIDALMAANDTLRDTMQGEATLG